MTIGAADFGYIRDLVRQRSAIMLEEGKEYLVVSRLSALATQEGFASLEHFLSELRNKPMNRLHLKVVEAMTTMKRRSSGTCIRSTCSSPPSCPS